MNDTQNVQEQKPTQNEQTETQKFTDAEIKRRLKNGSKGDLIKIIKNLALRIDAHIAHNESVRDMVDEINSDGGFKDYSIYTNLMDKVDEDV